MTSRLIRVAIAGACVLGGTCLWSSSPLKAQSDGDTGSFREAYSGQTARDPKTVRLKYIGASWDRVLKDFAKQTGRSLVMDSYPQGRVTRRDGTAYTVPEALRLLNSELETDGYRLLLQREHVVVLKLDQARSRYARPVVKQTPAVAQIRDRSTDNAAYQVARDTKPPIRRVSNFQQVMGQQVRSQEPFEEQTFKIANAKAADVARSIYDVFATRSTLNKSGVAGLPSFTVYHRSKTGQVSDREHFEIGINKSNNSLTVAAPANSIRQLINLIRELDQPAPGRRGQTVKVVEAENVKAKTTEELQRELNKIPRAMRTSFSPNRDNMFFSQESQDGGTPPPGPPQVGDDPRSMNLQGDVVLQPLDEIGAVVIKGNQADIDTVVGIIEELEELSKGTLPDINLVELKAVNSEALAELLTTVYENLSELRETGTGNERQNKIGFVPVVKPNAILVLAPQVDMPAIKELISKLDRPVNPTYEFEVFQLKHGIASQVVASLTTLTEEPTGLATRIRAVADVRSNSVIVQARPSDLEMVASLINRIDSDASEKVSRVKVIKLRNAVAEELTETIQTAIQNVINPPQTNVNFGQTGSTELRDSQSVVLEFFSRDGDIERLVRSGILVDVRVQADPRTNSIIVSAPEPSLELMEALIRELDGVPNSVADIKVFTLERADATQAVELLTGLFEDQNNQDEVGIAIAGADLAESTLVPLRFSADVRTNTVVAAGSLESLAIVEAILLRLDESKSLVSSRGIEVIQLNNILAESTAAQLTQFLEAQAELLDQDALRSGVERLANEVVVDFETQSNSLIVGATPEWQAKIRDIVEKLDVDPRQVVIQALLVEVALDNNDEFGIELGFQDPFNFLRGGVDAATGLLSPGFNFNQINQIPNATATSPNRVATQGLSNFGLGRQNSDLGFGGFVFSANSEAVNVLIRALQSRRSVHVLSRPMINATNGLEASIQVGQEVPVINGFTTTGLGNIQPTVERDDAGVILQVTPRISEDGTIQLSVYAEKSAFNGDGVPLIVDAATGNTIESPIKDVSVAQGDIILRNGQTAVFGGIISKADTTLERKVPWLGDVPLLGRAFRFDATETQRSELLIFLTPRIVKSAADTEVIKQIEAERLHYIESDAEELHGPIFSVPGQGSVEGFAPPANGILRDAYPAEEMMDTDAMNPIQPTSATTSKPRKKFGVSRPGNLLRRLQGKDEN